jgi:hypothetical protein
MSDVALSGGLQLNLLDWQEGLTERDLTEGPFNWVCRRALRVCVARERQDALALVAAFPLVDLWARPVFHACHNALPVAALPSLFDLRFETSQRIREPRKVPDSQPRRKSSPLSLLQKVSL